MTPEEVISLSISAQSKQLERARQRLAEASDILAKSEAYFHSTQRGLVDYQASRPGMYNELFTSIQGRSLNFIELDTYFAELDEIASKEIALENMISEAKLSLDTAEARVSKEKASLSRIQKKYEKTKEMYTIYIKKKESESSAIEEGELEEITQTLGISRSIFDTQDN